MNATLEPAALLEALTHRYATKAFDPNRTIPAPTWSALEQSLILTPSSYGLQPWKFLVLTDKALRESLVPHCWGQRQVADCSHLVVLAFRTGMTEEDIDRWVTRLAEVRGLPADSLSAYREMMVGDLVRGSRGREAAPWARNQVYIALGQFMLSAALLGIDTCPMEGFVPDQIDEALGLRDQGLHAAALCPAGFRAATDKYAALAKVRFPESELIERR